MFFSAYANAADDSEVSKEMATTNMKVVKDAIMQVVMSTPALDGIKIHHVDDYSVVFQKTIDNPMAVILYSNSHAMRYPANRLYFNLIPFSDKILVKSYVALVKNPGSGAEHELAPSSYKKDLQGIAQLLEEIKAVVEPGYIPLVIEEPKSNKKEEKPQEKPLGLKLGENGEIIEVQKDSYADGVLFVGDKILDINAQNISSMDKDAIESYIANKWGAGSSLVMVVEHEGQKNVISLKRKPE